MRLIITIFLIVTRFFTVAQRNIQAVGQWKYHIPFHEAVAITDAEDKIYCGTQLGLFSYQKETGELETYTKVEGLNDVEISTINYYKPLDILFIAYKNANIDIIQNNRIINLDDIKRKQIVGLKTINNIYFANDFAYLSCSFGVVIYDLKKLEVKDTYSSLGENGEVQHVYSATIAKDSLYLATDIGIISGLISSTENLLDFNNWNHSYNIMGVKTIVSIKNNILALNDSLQLIQSIDNNWKIVKLFGSNIKNIFEGNDEILLLKKDTLTSTDLSSTKNIDISKLTDPVQVLHDGDVFWFGDAQKGIIKLKNNTIEKLVPSGPTRGSVFRINYSNETIFMSSGGYNSIFARQFGSFIVDQLGDNNWHTTGYWQDQKLDGLADVVATLQTKAGVTYHATHGFGLVKKEKKEYTIFNSSNSPIENSNNGDLGYDRVTDIALDKQDNLWMTNHSVIFGDSSVFKLDKEGNWSAYAFPKILKSNFPERIAIDNDGNKWVTLSSASEGNGVLVFNEELEESRLLTKGFEKGDLQNTKISDLAVDKDGAVWLVGREGVSYFSTPSQVFEGGEQNDASRPIFDGRPLLEEEFVTCIAIDGGNRKWFGSDNGIWLMDPSGTEVIYNFNIENSPLPTNKINDIEVNQKTGEVFFGTDLGLISYRADATLGNNGCEGKSKVFPNPVTPEYNGQIGITGLTTNAEIKITDVWGNLIYETTANGGAAAWDMHDYLGNKAATGVYLIQVNAPDSDRSCVTRVAIVN